VTAVIGPNGSGKSNVGDAVLWVLGEQNIRALRGSTSQDVIFAGNDRRKPLGMAEVSLTIDNSARILPLEFAEVTVTRRVYRSGEGEFSSIGCRAVSGTSTSCFWTPASAAMRIRLSTRARSTRSSPCARRIAARSSKRPPASRSTASGKREALKKLENTRANLSRVNDIILEIEGQLEPLRRQAQVARRHQGSNVRAASESWSWPWYFATLRRLAAEG